MNIMTSYQGNFTPNVARAYRTIPVPQDEIARQHRQLDILIASLGLVSDEEFDAILEEGELDENGTGLDNDLQARIEAKIAAARLN